MRTVALDLGDVWIGVAISDPIGITARPYDTILEPHLITYIAQLLQEFQINTIVVGHPQTLRGTSSQQTIKIEEQVKNLATLFPSIKWALWDERLTSKQASNIKHAKTKEQKRAQHAIAAALILQSYLERQMFLKNKSESVL
ncbi:MAG TPA: Holliday junction resolvase RuvX [Candidatus Babeliales bacterium]|jgi:putative Holliday junction resolvase|nr:Holliday junction resolvase RuvX [Candidatus Babeliales bacterium]